MSETLEKLRPDRDLQCYFFRPSGIAALSNAGPDGYTTSGSWRQQFDWVVIEWNRDNVFEHPRYRYLPNGDLSGLTLTYRETRTNCIPMESGLYPTVDWPYLRIWAPDATGAEQVWRVKLKDHATPTAGSFAPGTATFTLSGTLTPGAYVELSWLDEHYYHQVTGSDTVATVLDDLKLNINTFSTTVTADVQNGDEIVLTNNQEGVEGNMLGVLGSPQWSPTSQQMTGGASPIEWEVTLDFSALTDPVLGAIPTTNVRKLRWTYAAALQPAAYERSEFAVVVSDWAVTGSGRAYQVAGPYSRRFGDEDRHLVYTGAWTVERGNYDGGTIRHTAETGATCRLDYQAQTTHRLYLGSRRALGVGSVSVQVDSGTSQVFDLGIPDEDFLLRLDLGELDPGSHSVVVTVTTPGFWFDFFELAVAADTVSEQPVHATQTLATDWDTDHSLALAPERVAWMMKMLGSPGGRTTMSGRCCSTS